MADCKHGGHRYKIPLEIRDKCIEIARSGIFTYREIANQLGVSHVLIWKWLNKPDKFDAKAARQVYVQATWKSIFPGEGNA